MTSTGRSHEEGMLSEAQKARARIIELANGLGINVGADVVSDLGLKLANPNPLETFYPSGTRAVYHMPYMVNTNIENAPDYFYRIEVLRIAGYDKEIVGLESQLRHRILVSPENVLGIEVDNAARWAAFYVINDRGLRAPMVLLSSSPEGAAARAVIRDPLKFVEAVRACLVDFGAAHAHKLAHRRVRPESVAFEPKNRVFMLIDWQYSYQKVVTLPRLEYNDAKDPPFVLNVRDDLWQLGISLLFLWVRWNILFAVSRTDMPVPDTMFLEPADLFRPSGWTWDTGYGLGTFNRAQMNQLREPVLRLLDRALPVKMVFDVLLGGRFHRPNEAAREVMRALNTNTFGAARLGPLRGAHENPNPLLDEPEKDEKPADEAKEEETPEPGGASHSFKQRCEETETTSCVIMVKGRVIFQYGTSQKNARIFSMTKSVMATMVAYYHEYAATGEAIPLHYNISEMMFGQAALAVDDALSHLREKLYGVTMNELLTQTSGIISKEYGGEDFAAMLFDPALDFEEYVNERIAGVEHTLHHKHTFHYDNIATQLAGMIFEMHMRRRHDQKYLLSEDVQERFLKGTDATWFTDAGTDMHRYTAAYTGIQADRATLLRFARKLMETPEYRRVLDKIEGWEYAAEVPHEHRREWRYAFCWWLPKMEHPDGRRRRVMTMIGFLGQYVLLDLDNDIIAIRQHAVELSDLVGLEDKFPTFVDEAVAFADEYIARTTDQTEQ